MILNTGQRTDIPAFYSEWFMERVRAGEVLVRSPYAPEKVTRLRIDPSVVDVVCFCTKDPSPMLPHLAELAAFRQFWHVTVTPYGPEIEPHVPPYERVCASVRRLSETLDRLGTEEGAAAPGIAGADLVTWRYDPVFLSEKYTEEVHAARFDEIAGLLEGSVRAVIVSFIDLYEKTKRNFPGAEEVPPEAQERLVRTFVRIAARRGMRVRLCLEDARLSACGADVSGCMTKQVLEQAFGCEIAAPPAAGHARDGCRCLLGSDIGAYNSCGHGCLYCYANADPALVRENMRRHDPHSTMLIGDLRPGDVVTDAKQAPWMTGQQVLRF